MFEPDEMGDFDEMLTGFFDGTLDDHHWIVATGDNDVVAAAAISSGVGPSLYCGCQQA